MYVVYNKSIRYDDLLIAEMNYLQNCLSKNIIAAILKTPDKFELRPVELRQGKEDKTFVLIRRTEVVLNPY